MHFLFLDKCIPRRMFIVASSHGGSGDPTQCPGARLFRHQRGASRDAVGLSSVVWLVGYINPREVKKDAWKASNSGNIRHSVLYRSSGDRPAGAFFFPGKREDAAAKLPDSNANHLEKLQQCRIRCTASAELGRRKSHTARSQRSTTRPRCYGATTQSVQRSRAERKK